MILLYSQDHFKMANQPYTKNLTSFTHVANYKCKLKELYQLQILTKD